MHVQTLIREGLPSEEIVAAAADHDLIVIGQRRAKRFWQMFSRHTVQAVLERAPCPVLVVREGQAESENL